MSSWPDNPRRRLDPDEPRSAGWTAHEDAPWSPLYDDRDPHRSSGRSPDRSNAPPRSRLDDRLADWDERLPTWSEDAAEAPPARRRTRLWWASRIVAGILLVFFLLVAWLAVTAPLSKSLQPIAPPQITLLASDGTPIARNGAIVDAPVHVKDLPRSVTQPFIAIEDRRFYSHWGVDPRGIARAAWGNLTSNRTQGGSTITQQLAKFTFLTPQQNITRKAHEALIAFWLEAWLSKDEILERYLSNAYFGDNTYGLRAAALHYFNRQPERLRPEQSAMLAGLLQAPTRYTPTTHFAQARARWRAVIGAMVDAGYLTPAQAKAMPVPVLDVHRARALPTGTYFADWALPQARALTEGGYANLTFTTTLDAKLQAAARAAIARASLGKAQVALVAMRPNGEVVAMVGGRDYGDSVFNRATQARRQPGSTFKLFVYLAALRDGWKPDDTISNLPIDTGAYRPKNAEGNYSKTITLENAFAHSSNVAAVRLFGEVGSKQVIKMARDLGVTSPLADHDPSLALGTSTMTLMELTAAYAGVAGNAFPVEPTAFAEKPETWLDWLWGGKGNVSDANHEAMEQMLRAAINRGTGRAATLSGPNFGKTGTTQDHRDALFVGYAGSAKNPLVVGVWVGNDDNSPLPGLTGGSVPARIWRDFMQSAQGTRSVPPPAKPRPDPGGPVQPQDVAPDEIQRDFRLDDGTSVHVGPDGAMVSFDLQGRPVEMRLDGSQGLSFAPGRVVRDEAAAAVREAREDAREARRDARDQARDALDQAEDAGAADNGDTLERPPWQQ